jgi:hypothetical protein
MTLSLAQPAVLIHCELRDKSPVLTYIEIKAGHEVEYSLNSSVRYSQKDIPESVLQRTQSELFYEMRELNINARQYCLRRLGFLRARMGSFGVTK